MGDFSIPIKVWTLYSMECKLLTIFIRNHKRILYSMNKKSVRKDKKIDLITIYEGRLKIVCH